MIEDVILIGSGTLVDIDGILGILTAQHVIEAIQKDEDINFVISKKLHKFSLKTQFLTRILIAKGTNSSRGPDIGFIKLPETSLGSIKAVRSFYNIGRRRDKILKYPPENNMGVWCLCGFPDEKTRHEGPQKGFNIVKNVLQLCGFGCISGQCVSNDFDYFDFNIHYNEKTQPPMSFGGVSGGGLWQVIIDRRCDGELILKEIILSGVAFYQSSLKDNMRIIKCHGRQTVYDQAYHTVKSKCSS